MYGNSHNKKQVLILLVVITIGLLGVMISGVVSEPVEAQSTYHVNYTFTEHSTGVTSVEILDNGNIVTGSRDNTAKIWNPDTGNVLLNFDEHNALVWAVEQLDNGDIITVAWDNTAKIWNPDTGNVLLNFDEHTNNLYDVEQLDNGDIITTSEDETAKIWDRDTGNVKLTFNGHSNWVLAAHQLDNGDIATGSLDTTVKIWDRDTGNVKRTFDKHSFRVWDIEQLDNGSILSTSTDNTAKIWNPDTKKVYTTFDDHTGNVLDGEQLTNGNIITASIDNTARIWNPTTGIQNVKFTNHTSSLNDVEQLSNGNIVTASKDNTVKIWDAGLPSATDRIANPIAVTDVQQPSTDFTFYVIGNSDLESGDTLTWSFGDGTTTTAQANKTVTHDYDTYGRYTVNVTTSDGNTRSTKVVVHTAPSVSNIINPNPALDGETITLDGTGSDDRTTAARPNPTQLQVYAGIRSWIPYIDASSIDDSLYNGWFGDGVETGSNASKNNPTSLYSVYNSSEKDQSYITNPVDLQQNWTVSTFVASDTNSVIPVWLSASGHGVYFDNGDLKRVYPTGNETIDQIDPSNGGVNLTVTHDSSGSFTYYVDGTEIGSDTYSSIVQDATYIIQVPNQIANHTQDTDIYLDDWRIYNRQLSQNEIDLIDDKYTVKTLDKDKLYYQWELDNSIISTSSTHTINGLPIGSYEVELTVQDNDGFISNDTKTLNVNNVVSPRIDNVVPEGKQNSRTVNIEADISHPEISNNYPIKVELVRTNLVTGNTDTLVDKNITSNQRVSYTATHDNTGIGNYAVDRENFAYQWVATEPVQNKQDSVSKEYSIPANAPEWRNVLPNGINSDLTVNYRADLTGSVATNVDVALRQYDYRNDTQSEIYTNTVTPPTTVSYDKTYGFQTNSIPQDYRSKNLYTYRWIAITNFGNVTSDTKQISIPSVTYVVDKTGKLIGQDVMIESHTSTNAVFYNYQIADVTEEDYFATVNSSGYADQNLYITDFARGHSVMLYNKSKPDIFEKEFDLSGIDEQLTQINVTEAYLTFQTDANNRTLMVSQNPVSLSDKATALLQDGVTYQLAVRDSEHRRVLGEYTADKSDSNETQELSSTNVEFSPEKSYQVEINGNKYNESEGYIDFTFSSNNDSISDLDVTVIRQNDSKIIYQDSQAGKVSTYSATYNITHINQSYKVKWNAYNRDTQEQISGSQVVQIGFQKLLGDLPDAFLTAAAVFFLIMVVGIIGMVSAPWALPIMVVFSGIFVLIGWLPLSMTVVMQAGLIAVLYYVSRSDV